MNCPRCEHDTLREKDRDGITIDRCDACRGIWLDRGELEKLMARRPIPVRYAHDEPHEDEDDEEDPKGGKRRGSFWALFD